MPALYTQKTNSPSLFVQLCVTLDAFFFSYSLLGSFLPSNKEEISTHEFLSEFTHLNTHIRTKYVWEILFFKGHKRRILVDGERVHSLGFQIMPDIYRLFFPRFVENENVLARRPTVEYHSNLLFPRVYVLREV